MVIDVLTFWRAVGPPRRDGTEVVGVCLYRFLDTLREWEYLFPSGDLLAIERPNPTRVTR